MSYRIRGEVVVDVEDYHYNGDIEVATDCEGISELMSENNITTAELVDYQNNYGSDEYKLNVSTLTLTDLDEYISEIDLDRVSSMIGSLFDRARYLYMQEQQMCSDLQSEKEALKRRIGDLEEQLERRPVPNSSSIGTSNHIS